MILHRERYLLVLLMALLFQDTGIAQLPDYHVQFFDESYGIRSDMDHVIKDDRGFIWLTSQDHVYRFDGKNTKEFPFSEHIISILCDDHGIIRVNSDKHIYQFKNDLIGFIPFAFDTTDHLRFGRMLKLDDDVVLAQTNKGIYQWDQEKNQFQKFNPFPSAIPPRINTPNFSNYGNTIFFATQDSFYAVDVEMKTRLSLPKVNDQGGMYAISKTDMLITSRSNITSWCNFTTQKISPINFENDIPGRNNDFLFVQDVLPLDDNRILVASHTGLLELDKRTKHFRLLKLFNKGYQIEPSPELLDLFLDDEKKVWLIQSTGLLHFSTGNETIGLIRNHETNDKNAWPNNARNFAEDEKGNLWISTSQGFGYWDQVQNTITMIPAAAGAKDQLNMPSVRGLIYAKPWLMMGTSSAGVWLYNTATEKFQRPVYKDDSLGSLKKKIEVEFIRQIMDIPGDHYLIIGRDCYIINKKNFSLEKFDVHSSEAHQINIGYIDAEKNIWLGTSLGLIHYDSTMTSMTEWKFGLPVYAISQSGPLQLVLGTDKGMYNFMLQGDSMILSRNEHLAGISRVAFIKEDHGGKYWIGSSEGLSRYDPATHHVDLYDYSDNVQGNIFSSQPLLDSHGVLFVGGTNGINYFHPDSIPPKKDSLIVSIIRITVNQDDTSFFDRSALMSLGYRQNSIEIEFMAPYYGNTNRIQYRYRIAGLGEEWKNNGINNKVRLTSLPAGDYQFQVAASMNGVKWFQAAEVLKFTINPPFWKTWWFLFAAGIASVAILIYFMRARINRVREKEKIKSNYEKRIAEVEMQTLRAQMNPHFMFNSLNSINNFILKNDPDNASGYLTKFSRLMRLILDNSRSEWVLLENELKALELYIQLEVVRFDHVFDYVIDVAPDINVTAVSIPPMMIQPYVENAIWHGLLHRNLEGGKLWIRLWRDQGELHISIEDNGVGRAEAQRLKSKTATKHKSHGMKITAERIEIVNRIYHVNAKVSIDDLPGKNGIAGGTKVSLTMQPRIYDSHNRG